MNMTTKRPSKKQIIVSIGSNNVERVMAKAKTIIVNINRLLKGIKSKVSVDFIQADSKGLLLTTNKVAATSNLNIVEKYLKELNNSEIISSRLP